MPEAEGRGSWLWVAGGAAAVAVTAGCAYLAHAFVKKRRVDRVLAEVRLGVPYNRACTVVALTGSFCTLRLLKACRTQP